MCQPNCDPSPLAATSFERQGHHGRRCLCAHPAMRAVGEWFQNKELNLFPEHKICSWCGEQSWGDDNSRSWVCLHNCLSRWRWELLLPSCRACQQCWLSIHIGIGLPCLMWIFPLNPVTQLHRTFHLYGSKTPFFNNKKIVHTPTIPYRAYINDIQKLLFQGQV